MIARWSGLAGPNGKASVIFTLPAAVDAGQAPVCGEWNDWSPDANVMDVVEDGFSLTIELEVGRTYRFRYLLDGQRWENDWHADFYVPNGYGGDDSVVDLTRLDAPPPAPAPPGNEATSAGPRERFARGRRADSPEPTDDRAAGLGLIRFCGSYSRFCTVRTVAGSMVRT